MSDPTRYTWDEDDFDIDNTDASDEAPEVDETEEDEPAPKGAE